MNRLLILSFLLSPFLHAHATSCPSQERFDSYGTLAQGRNALAGYGLMVLDTRDGKVTCERGWQMDEVVYPASAMKVFVVAAALRAVDQGKLTLETPISITQRNANSDCGGKVCAGWGIGTQKPLRNLLEATIVDSNNITTNELMDLIGKEEINKTAWAFGAVRTLIRRKVYASVDPEPEILQRNESTARDLLVFYRELYFNHRRLISPKSRSYFLSLLRRTRHNNRLNLHFKDQHVFYHKTGSTSRSASDAGFLLVKEKLIIMAGLQESPTRVIGGRWDFQLFARMGKELVGDLTSEEGHRPGP